jgi:D-alanyl-lipoteichoic acid acyltransferase DltB (MBOAT superfamily)
MGFRLSLNFNLPYKAKNIGEFWKRWHISLSSWLRDYLFMPIALKLSGMMKKEMLFNLPWLKSDQVIFWMASLITFTLCGLWHGAGINFLIWGLMHGVALSVQKTWSLQSKERKRRRDPKRRKIFQVMGIASTFSFVTLGWLFFRTETPEQALTVAGQIVTDFHGEAFPAFLSAYTLPLLLMIATYLWHFLPDRYGEILREKYGLLPLPLKIAIVSAVISLAWLSQQQGSARPIYIRF